MRLQSDGGVVLDLEIEGYEFPELGGTAFDASWLEVSVSVQHPRGCWNARSPSLLESEVQRLALWLRGSAGRNPPPPYRGFRELELRFERHSDEIHVRLGHAFRPPWCTTPERERGDAVLTFPRDELQLYRAARSLLNRLQELDRARPSARR